ncbi:MAG TPA: DUF4832 domain-containing protein [Panacibacter sp.]|nr:DUF4832 domain-containing protein [Panacibacter sp.]
MKKIAILVFTSAFCIASFTVCSKFDKPAFYYAPATDTLLYTESAEDFPNPERGFYRVAETHANNYQPLDVNQLKEWRTLQQADDGEYNVYSTLTFRNIVLDGFTSKDLPEDLLTKIKTDFASARTAGIKLIVRFTYNVNPQSGSCPEGFICPPYKDASKEFVLKHIAQLKPIFQENADVLACLQMGFIGMWGENYYSDFFGDASSNSIGKFTDENWADKNEVLKALLDAVPADRMIQVRTPQLKQRYVYGVNASTNSAALTEAESFNETDKSRIGFHNDCFLSSPSDYGTYDDYGNSSSDRISGNILKPYMMEDSRFVAVGGETCDDTYSPYNDCEAAGKAQTEMRNLHYSFLNCAYNNDVNNDWQTGGCMDSIKNNLGYRFVMRSALYPLSAVEAGKLFSFTLNIENVGYASPFNQRPVKLIMRNQQTATEFSFDVDTDIRKWFSGINNLKITTLTQTDMPKGVYDLFLYMPDKYESITSRTEYAIRCANTNCWEETTGYNKLGFTVKVK